jgi:hypothetical protein
MRLSLGIAAVAATFAAASPAFAQSYTETAEARGTILQSLTLTKASDLDFGTIAADALVAGTVSIDPDTGARSSTNVSELPGVFSRAQFDGLGADGQIVELTLSQPAAGVLVNVAGDEIPAVLTIDADGLTRTLPASGLFSVYIGGDFDIAANQANGLYTAQFDLTAEYQ